MKSYYYLDYLHREIFLEEEDIQTVPESGRADDACSAIAEKPYGGWHWTSRSGGL